MIKFDIYENFQRLFDVVETHYGNLDIEIKCAHLDDDQDPCLGQSDFDNKLILVDVDQTPDQMVNIIAHELAHFICGLNEDHGVKWQDTYENIYHLYHDFMTQPSNAPRLEPYEK